MKLLGMIGGMSWESTSRDAYRRIMERLVERGAQGVILGCTEITMRIGAEDARVPLFDTTALHVQAAADWMTAENPT
jgi:aspartate racemase